MDKLNEINQKLNDLKLSEEQKAYVLAKAWYETLKNADEEIEKKVLQENVFYIKENKGSIRHGRYLMTKGDRVKASYELDEEQFNKYMKLYYAECDKQGIKWEWNRCIDADARESLKKAENVLIDWFIGQTNKFKELKCLDMANIELAKKHWKYREQLIDLAMKWHSDWDKYAA